MLRVTRERERSNPRRNYVHSAEAFPVGWRASSAYSMMIIWLFKMAIHSLKLWQTTALSCHCCVILKLTWCVSVLRNETAIEYAELFHQRRVHSLGNLDIYCKGMMFLGGRIRESQAFMSWSILRRSLYVHAKMPLTMHISCAGVIGNVYILIIRAN